MRCVHNVTRKLSSKDIEFPSLNSGSESTRETGITVHTFVVLFQDVLKEGSKTSTNTNIFTYI